MKHQLTLYDKILQCPPHGPEVTLYLKDIYNELQTTSVIFDTVEESEGFSILYALRVFECCDNSTMKTYLEPLLATVQETMNHSVLRLFGDNVLCCLDSGESDVKKESLLAFYMQMIEIGKTKGINPQTIFPLTEMTLYKFMDHLLATKNILLQAVELGLVHLLLPDINKEIAQKFFPENELHQTAFLKFKAMPYESTVQAFINCLNSQHEDVFSLETTFISIGGKQYGKDTMTERTYIDFNCTKEFITLRIINVNGSTAAIEIKRHEIELVQTKEYPRLKVAEVLITMKHHLKISELRHYKVKSIKFRFTVEYLSKILVYKNHTFMSLFFGNLGVFQNPADTFEPSAADNSRNVRSESSIAHCTSPELSSISDAPRTSHSYNTEKVLSNTQLSQLNESITIACSSNMSFTGFLAPCVSSPIPGKILNSTELESAPKQHEIPEVGDVTYQLSSTSTGDNNLKDSTIKPVSSYESSSIKEISSCGTQRKSFADSDNDEDYGEISATVESIVEFLSDEDVLAGQVIKFGPTENIEMYTPRTSSVRFKNTDVSFLTSDAEYSPRHSSNLEGTEVKQSNCYILKPVETSYNDDNTYQSCNESLPDEFDKVEQCNLTSILSECFESPLKSPELADISYNIDNHPTNIQDMPNRDAVHLLIHDSEKTVDLQSEIISEIQANIQKQNTTVITESTINLNKTLENVNATSNVKENTASQKATEDDVSENLLSPVLATKQGVVSRFKMRSFIEPIETIDLSNSYIADLNLRLSPGTFDITSPKQEDISGIFSIEGEQLSQRIDEFHDFYNDAANIPEKNSCETRANIQVLEHLIIQKGNDGLFNKESKRYILRGQDENVQVPEENIPASVPCDREYYSPTENMESSSPVLRNTRHIASPSPKKVLNSINNISDKSASQSSITMNTVKSTYYSCDKENKSDDNTMKATTTMAIEKSKRLMSSQSFGEKSQEMNIDTQVTISPTPTKQISAVFLKNKSLKNVLQKEQTDISDSDTCDNLRDLSQKKATSVDNKLLKHAEPKTKLEKVSKYFKEKKGVNASKSLTLSEAFEKKNKLQNRFAKQADEVSEYFQARYTERDLSTSEIIVPVTSKDRPCSEQLHSPEFRDTIMEGDISNSKDSTTKTPLRNSEFFNTLSNNSLSLSTENKETFTSYTCQQTQKDEIVSKYFKERDSTKLSQNESVKKITKNVAQIINQLPHSSNDNTYQNIQWEDDNMSESSFRENWTEETNNEHDTSWSTNDSLPLSTLKKNVFEETETQTQDSAKDKVFKYVLTTEIDTNQSNMDVVDKNEFPEKYTSIDSGLISDNNKTSSNLIHGDNSSSSNSTSLSGLHKQKDLKSNNCKKADDCIKQSRTVQSEDVINPKENFNLEFNTVETLQFKQSSFALHAPETSERYVADEDTTQISEKHSKSIDKQNTSTNSSQLVAPEERIAKESDSMSQTENVQGNQILSNESISSAKNIDESTSHSLLTSAAALQLSKKEKIRTKPIDILEQTNTTEVFIQTQEPELDSSSILSSSSSSDSSEDSSKNKNIQKTSRHLKSGDCSSSTSSDSEFFSGMKRKLSNSRNLNIPKFSRDNIGARNKPFVDNFEHSSIGSAEIESRNLTETMEKVTRPGTNSSLSSTSDSLQQSPAFRKRITLDDKEKEIPGKTQKSVALSQPRKSNVKDKTPTIKETQTHTPTTLNNKQESSTSTSTQYSTPKKQKSIDMLDDTSKYFKNKECRKDISKIVQESDNGHVTTAKQCVPTPSPSISDSSHSKSSKITKAGKGKAKDKTVAPNESPLLFPTPEDVPENEDISQMTNTNVTARNIEQTSEQVNEEDFDQNSQGMSLTLSDLIENLDSASDIFNFKGAELPDLMQPGTSTAPTHTEYDPQAFLNDPVRQERIKQSMRRVRREYQREMRYQMKTMPIEQQMAFFETLPKSEQNDLVKLCKEVLNGLEECNRMIVEDFMEESAADSSTEED